DLAGDTALEQGQVLRPADARDEEVQGVKLRRIDLDERTRKEVRLLLVVTLQSHSVAWFEKRLHSHDDRLGFQHVPLHPGRKPGQSSGLLRPTARPRAGLSGERNGSIHVVLFLNVSRRSTGWRPQGSRRSGQLTQSRSNRHPATR